MQVYLDNKKTISLDYNNDPKIFLKNKRTWFSSWLALIKLYMD